MKVIAPIVLSSIIVILLITAISLPYWSDVDYDFRVSGFSRTYLGHLGLWKYDVNIEVQILGQPSDEVDYSCSICPYDCDGNDDDDAEQSLQFENSACDSIRKVRTLLILGVMIEIIFMVLPLLGGRISPLFEWRAHVFSACSQILVAALTIIAVTLWMTDVESNLTGFDNSDGVSVGAAWYLALTAGIVVVIHFSVYIFAVIRSLRPAHGTIQYASLT